MVALEKADIIRVTNDVSFVPNSSIRIAPISIDNVSDGITFNTQDELNQFLVFLEEGHIGYYAYYEGECASRIWFFKREDRCRVGHNFLYRLPESEYFLGWAQTDPKFRNLGLYGHILRFGIHDNPEKTISGYVESSNIASLKGTQKAGFITVKRFILIKIWRLKLQILTYNFQKGSCLRLNIGTFLEP